MEPHANKQVLVIEDDRTFNQLLCKQLTRMGLSPTGVQRWGDGQEFLRGNEPALVLMDVQLPDGDGIEILRELGSQFPVIVLTAFGSVKNAVNAIKSGAAEYLIKPVNLDELEITVNRVLENAHLRQDWQFYRSRSKAVRKNFVVGHSAPIRRVMEMVDAVAPTGTTVLIQGESGVGKELVAREIHERSFFAKRNYVALDCCTLQENLFESELFGHERGSFTGADRQKKGLIEAADGGTLFLDEIGEITAAIQAKLLRVLETGQFRRLGGTKDLLANARIVAATNRDLGSMARLGTFRQDLFYRLNAFVITVPPLRERRDDIPDIIEHFIHHHGFSRRIDKTVSPNAMRVMMTYDWPGNVRELRNVMERAIILSRDETRIEVDHLGLDVKPKPPPGETFDFDMDGEPTLEDLKERYMRYMYRKLRGHRSNLARAMGISERNTYRLIRRYGLSSDPE
ncbi:MAG: sigma-54 dependent transcriptional regulator [Magnetospirillum sp. WYHS-4]